MNRLALVTEYLNCRPLIMYVPKYRISLAKGGYELMTLHECWHILHANTYTTRFLGVDTHT